MNYPPRLSHLCTRQVGAAKLVPTYALVHHIDEEEAHERLERALQGKLWDQLLDATWEALKGKITKRLDEQGLLQKVANSLADRPLRPGRPANVTPTYSAFLLLVDIEAGTASDAARRVLELPAGREKAQAGLKEAGEHLAAELTR